MIELIAPADDVAVRNKNNLVAFYDELFRLKKPAQVAERYLAKEYIQHNPLAGDGAEGFVGFFSRITSDFPSASVVVHRVIAVGDYVWAHAHFRNVLSNDPDDPGFAVVDIWRMTPEGKAAEHWDVLQSVGTETDSAPWAGPGIPRANANGLF